MPDKSKLHVTILQNNIKTVAAKRYHEDKGISKLKILAAHGLNTEIGVYSEEIYNFYQYSNELCHNFRYYVHMIMKNMTDFGLN